MWDNSRYGSQQMKMLWSRGYQIYLWCEVWRHIVDKQADALGIEKPLILVDFNHTYLPDEESNTGHEIDSIRQTLEEKYPELRMLHFGLTSSDVADNADAIRVTRSVDFLRRKLAFVIEQLGLAAFKYAETPALGYTHLQPAEVTSFGYRLLSHVEEFYGIWRNLPNVQQIYPLTKGRSGAVGSGVLLDLFASEKGDFLVSSALRALHQQEGVIYRENLTVSQTSSRANENQHLQQMASIAIAAARFANNVRHLQMLDQITEPNLGSVRHVGSSAMPHKQNPILSENISALSRVVLAMVSSHSAMCSEQILERTLDDSALRRVVLPQIFLYVDEILDKLLLITKGWTIHQTNIRNQVVQNLAKVMSSRLLSALVLMHPLRTRSYLYEQVQHAIHQAEFISHPDLEEFQTKVCEYFPGLEAFIKEKGIEEQFWDVWYLGTLPSYVLARVTPIHREVRNVRKNEVSDV